MKDYLANLSRRERFILLAGLLVGGTMLLYILLIEPFQSSLNTYRRQIPAKEKTFAWMTQAAREIIYLRENRSSTTLTSSSAPLSIIDSSAGEVGLSRSLKRVEPEGKDTVKIWLEEALFDDILSWLSLLRTSHGIQAREILAESLDRSGYVKARITLVQNNS